jgi:hypothetical protein
MGDGKVPCRHLPWGTHGFAGGPSGGGDAGEDGGGDRMHRWLGFPPVLPEEGDGVIRLKRIYNFLCSMLVLTPFA